MAIIVNFCVFCSLLKLNKRQIECFLIINKKGMGIKYVF